MYQAEDEERRECKCRLWKYNIIVEANVSVQWTPFKATQNAVEVIYDTMETAVKVDGSMQCKDGGREGCSGSSRVKGWVHRRVQSAEEITALSKGVSTGARKSTLPYQLARYEGELSLMVPTVDCTGVLWENNRHVGILKCGITWKCVSFPNRRIRAYGLRLFVYPS